MNRTRLFFFRSLSENFFNRAHLHAGYAYIYSIARVCMLDMLTYGDKITRRVSDKPRIKRAAIGIWVPSLTVVINFD